MNEKRFEKFIEQRFKKATEYYLNLKNGNNFDTHVAFIKTQLSAYVTHYDPEELEQALEMFKQDNNIGINKIWEALKETILLFANEQEDKGERIIKKHQSNQTEIKDNKDGTFNVESTSGGEFYTIDLNEYSCTCYQYNDRIGKYMGMICKHICALSELHGDEYPLPLEGERIKVKKTNKIEKSSEDVYKKDHFSYGIASVKIRQASDHPLIPSKRHFILEGGEPELALHSISKGKFILLRGHTGSGKTDFVRYIAAETNTPLSESAQSGDVKAEDLIGIQKAKEGSTYFDKGILPKAMEDGTRLLLNEINTMDPAVLVCLNQLFDDSSITILMDGKPMTVRAHKDFRIICTMNPDESLLYHGRNEMSTDFLDRFNLVIDWQYLSAEAEEKLIMKETGYKVSKEVNKMVKLANLIRNALLNDQMMSTITTRGLIECFSLAKHFNLKTSAETSLFSKMRFEDRELAKSHFIDLFGK